MSEDRPPRIRGTATQWTPAQIARLTGIDENGVISPAVLGDAKADARRFPDLHALLTAQERRGPRGDS